MKILIKGAGDLATGIAWRLHQCGHQIVMTEIATPLTVRRLVAFSRAVYEGHCDVEGVEAVLGKNYQDIAFILSQEKIAVIVDEKAQIKKAFQPEVIIDAILAKKNLGTQKDDAAFVIGVGPGFYAGEDCDCVIETKRGHYLGRVIWEGAAIKNTGVPGNVGGYTMERLIKATKEGVVKPSVSIGDMVEEGQVVAYTGEEPVFAKMPGIVRGMLQEGVYVTEGLKIGDIDARCQTAHCYSISDKARSIGGGVLEAIGVYAKKRSFL